MSDGGLMSLIESGCPAKARPTGALAPGDSISTLRRHRDGLVTFAGCAGDLLFRARAHALPILRKLFFWKLIFSRCASITYTDALERESS
jgi:hypothetical protein